MPEDHHTAYDKISSFAYSDLLKRSATVMGTDPT